MKVNDRALSGIIIYCSDPESRRLAEAVGYGAEEEGLPYKIAVEKLTYAEAFDRSKKAGLGVVVLVTGEDIAVFTRQLNKQKPLFDFKAVKYETAERIGKNAARIIKNKPFVDLEE
jgi:hypothetical protein